MRYIGNKENLCDKIYHTLQIKNIEGKSFFDFFAGTTSVGQYFKSKGYKVFSSDLMYFSYVLQRAYITNNSFDLFDKLLQNILIDSTNLFETNLEKVVSFLNKISGKEGFIYENYTPTGTQELEQPRMFFSDQNGKIIDAIRLQIEQWKEENLISTNEYFILIACLLESVSFYANVAGVYAAFHKKWDPRAVKKMVLRPIKLITSKEENRSFNQDSVELLEEIQADIFYLDPPYNQRQYAPNYHLLETIAKYDNPQIKGVSGMRDYQQQKSKFCNSKTALEELNKIALKGKFKYLVLSYNSEGIMKEKDIFSVLQKCGKVELVEFDYLRFKSNNNGKSKHKKYIREQLYILEK
ncbi:DNA methyltransferase [Capnocytophaga canimorsus]|uniref:DNA methyltransferase n=1 Tax=Capnocytophaga canimorsus TaxID=28188 RepID=A0A250G5N7_9FLAO|nr:DNA adenine methylase [Capnocytophaga canimorsus]ATA92521.1 DNA methyltransferase [Capnocytophaga canimorsus]